MSEPATTEQNQLDALAAATSDAIAALAAWDIPAFQQALERQRALTETLAQSPVQLTPSGQETARRLRTLNQIYRRLVEHSMRWSRTLQTILNLDGQETRRDRASIHFRG